MTLSPRAFGARSGQDAASGSGPSNGEQSHLRDVEFVDLVDGTLPAVRMQHVNECSACRAQADELSAAMTAAATVDVPEPSPVFWNQFSSRVRTAVSNEPPQPGRLRQFLQPTRLRWAGLAAAAVLVLAIGLWRTTSVSGPSPEQQRATIAPAERVDVLSDDTFGDIESDEGWALVRTFADELAA